MKDYYKLILEDLVNSYERRKDYAKQLEKIRANQVVPEKLFKEYTDRYNHESYRDINVAIEKLVRDGLAEANSDISGKYVKVKANVSRISGMYRIIGKTEIPILCNSMRSTLTEYITESDGILNRFCVDQLTALNQFNKIPYDIGYDNYRLKSILLTLKAVLKLKKETYIRNFSTALYRDSKVFQKSMRSTIQSILFDYSDIIVEKDRILERYNLFDNPTYVMIKGAAIICYEETRIILSEMCGGIAIPNDALDKIRSLVVLTDRIITVENLTTYHDTQESEGVVIYLGGFHNKSKQKLLRLIYEQNTSKIYLHKGDLDVYGFLILENLKEKTGIPFEPLEMDVKTLQKFYECGLFKPLSAVDKKAMKSEKLKNYKEVLNFMLVHDCKVEQESLKAVELINR